MTFLDKFQQAWQLQCNKPIDINPDQLLKAARMQRRMLFLCDLFVIVTLLSVGTWMLRMAFRDIHKQWPWLIYSACLAWVILFMLFNQWWRRRHAPHFDAPVLAHVQWSIEDLEHRMWQDRYTFWWYTLPIALGCIIPPTITFGLEFHVRHDLESLYTLVTVLVMFTAIFAVIHWTIKTLGRAGLGARLRELETLRALRDSLLKEESGQQG